MRFRIGTLGLGLAVLINAGAAHAVEPLRIAVVPDAGATQVSVQDKGRCRLI